MLNYDLVRAEYGFLGDCTHLGCCSVGVPPRRVQAACQGFYSHYMDLVYGKTSGYAPLRAAAREKAAQLLHCRPEEIAFSSSTTEGLCILAAGYPLGPRDNVVMCDLENPCAMLPWVNAAQNRGFELRIAKTEGGRIEPHQLLALADENTKIICLSAIQYGTGFFADLRAIGHACRQRGIVFAVDAIQAVGRMVIDVEAMGIDYLSSGGFKGLGAGFGISLIYCANHLAPRIKPAHAGNSGVQRSIYAPEVFDANPELALRDDARRLETGSHNTLGIVLLDASLSLILEFGPAEVEGHIRALEARLRRGLEGTHLELTGPVAADNQSGMLVLYYPESLYGEAQAIFEGENMVLTSHPGFIRLALHCFNTEAHVETTLRALRALSDRIPKAQ